MGEPQSRWPTPTRRQVQERAARLAELRTAWFRTIAGLSVHVSLSEHRLGVRVSTLDSRGRPHFPAARTLTVEMPEGAPISALIAEALRQLALDVEEGRIRPPAPGET